MTEADSNPCSVCLSNDHRGVLLATEHAGEAAIPLAPLSLCAPCFGMLHALVSGDGAAGGPDRCTRCGGEASDLCFALHFEERGAGPRLQGERDFTLCPACFEVAQQRVEDESEARWERRRPGDRESRHLARTGAPRVVAEGLVAADTECIRDAALVAGLQFAARLPRFASGKSICFAPAAAVPELMDGPDRPHAVVAVASAADASQLAAALRAGAADFVASPLSKPQVRGALDRIGEAAVVRERDAATGLPCYYRVGRIGTGFQVITIDPGLEDPVAVALVLRRFLRGSDRVGLGEHGCLEVHAACEDDVLPVVLRRLQHVLGAGHAIAAAGFLPPATALDAGPRSYDGVRDLRKRSSVEEAS